MEKIAVNTVILVVSGFPLGLKGWENEFGQGTWERSRDFSCFFYLEHVGESSQGKFREFLAKKADPVLHQSNQPLPAC